MQTISAIPTDYRGVHFRSRLEAKWACFFDNVGWPWEYEPIDLDGYIPDFILPFYEPMLVEVKPEVMRKDLGQHISRIEKSGWTGEALILGAAIFEESGWGQIGLSGERDEQKSWLWAQAIFHKCRKCRRESFYNFFNIFTCRVNGCYDGNHYLQIIDYDDVRRLFAEASRMVQYNAD